jgi:hypothetical protein
VKPTFKVSLESNEILQMDNISQKMHTNVQNFSFLNTTFYGCSTYKKITKGMLHINPKRVLSMNLKTRLRSRPRNRWQDEVREDGRIVGGEEWNKKYIKERNRRSS